MKQGLQIRYQEYEDPRTGEIQMIRARDNLAQEVLAFLKLVHVSAIEFANYKI